MIVVILMGIDDEPADEHDDDPRWRITPTKIVVAAILTAAIVIPLLVWTYARDAPRLFGFPFFYWYQLLWVFLAAGLCWLAYTLLRRESRQYEARTGMVAPTGPPPSDPAPEETAPRHAGNQRQSDPDDEER